MATKQPQMKVDEVIAALKPLGYAVEKLGRRDGKTGPYVYKTNGKVYTLAELREFYTSLSAAPTEATETSTEEVSDELATVELPTEDEVVVAEEEGEDEVEMEYDFMDQEYSFDEAEMFREDDMMEAFGGEDEMSEEYATV